MLAMVMEVMPLHKIGAAMGITALVIMFAPCSDVEWRKIIRRLSVLMRVSAWALFIDRCAFKMRTHLSAFSALIN